MLSSLFDQAMEVNDDSRDITVTSVVDGLDRVECDSSSSSLLANPQIPEH